MDPSIVHLNHGSFGACPRVVLEAQQEHRARMERDAVSFFAADLSKLLDPSREAVAPLLGAQPESIVFVRNATQGVLTALTHAARVGISGPPLGSGDEILIADHEYPACKNNAEAIAGRCGAHVRYVSLGTPTAPIDSVNQRITADVLFERIMAGVTERTRVCLLSLITSPSGVRLPVERLIPALRARGVETILDAAHGIGCVPIDLEAWQPAFFTTNAHKWLCAPKGAAIFWARDDIRPRVRPLILSNEAHKPESSLRRSRWQTEFDYLGTDEVTQWLCIADAAREMPKIAGTDWPGIMRANHELVLTGRDALCKALGVLPPVDDELLGPMAMVPLPAVTDPERANRLAARPTRFGDALIDTLLDRYRISVPLPRALRADGSSVPVGQRVIRISAQVYNAPEQYAYLAGCLLEALADEAKL